MKIKLLKVSAVINNVTYFEAKWMKSSKGISDVFCIIGALLKQIFELT